MRFRAATGRWLAELAERAGRNTLCVLCVCSVLLSFGCSGAGLFRQYEYEEEMYLSLDGTATMYVNSSVAAFNALRGTSFDTNPTAPLDRDRIRAYFSSPNTHVTWVRPSRRNGRRFLHVRLNVDDVRKLNEAAPFKWSSYRFGQNGNLFVYLQTIGQPSGMGPESPGWNGNEVVAFRLHLPSKIEYQNTGTDAKRGNILVWEQPLADRLHGTPLELEARMQTQSILYRTMWLFGATFLVVAAAFGLVIWWVVRRGAAADPSVRPRPSAGSAPTTPV